MLLWVYGGPYLLKRLHLSEHFCPQIYFYNLPQSSFIWWQYLVENSLMLNLHTSIFFSIIITIILIPVKCCHVESTSTDKLLSLFPEISDCRWKIFSFCQCSSSCSSVFGITTLQCIVFLEGRHIYFVNERLKSSCSIQQAPEQRR